MPTTAGSLPEPYLEAYEKAARRAPNILCLTLSSRLSGMYNAALLAARLAGESLPGVTIEVLECSSAAAPERARELRDRIANRFNTVELFITEFTPVMGVHTGPGLVGAAFYAEEPPSGQNSAKSL